MKHFICIVLAFATLSISACAKVAMETDDHSHENDTVSESSAVANSSESAEDTTTDSNEIGEPSVPDVSNEPSQVESTESSDYIVAGNSGESSKEPSVPNPAPAWNNTLRTQQDRDYHGYTAEALDDYFDDALFVGDSVANGLKIYTKSYESVFTNMVFHTGASYGFHNAVRKITSTSVHPIYQGAQRTIWDMVSITGANKVIIGFGLNDFGYTSKKSVQNCMDTIISNLKAVKPDIQIIFLSSGYFTKEGEVYRPDKNDYRTNQRQREYNQFVLEYCNSVGVDYIDVSNCLADDNGYLPKEISLDNYCHPKITEYTVWRDILYSYAANKMLGTHKNPTKMQ